MIPTIALLAAAATPALQPLELGGRLYHPRRILAKLDAGATPSQIGAKFNVIRTFPEIGWIVVEAPKNQLQLTKTRLEATSGVAKAEFDRAAKPAYTPNDPMWPDMWHMTAIKADLAWDHSFGSNQITVAVIDTGVDVLHEDLAANIWVNTDEIAGNSIDDDNNGYVDDRNGYDFAYNDPDPNDAHGHGTSCSGLVAAVQDNNLGVTGVAPRAKVMALKAAIDSGYFYASNDIAAYLYAANNGAKVLSMSYFSDLVTAAEGDAINFCWNNNVLPVAAAGNDSTNFPYYPAAYDRTLAVAALNTNMNKAGFSNYGLWVDVAAPGTSLRTTTSGGGYTSGFGGTSGACPHVAGLAALVWGANLSLTNAQVRNIIEDTAAPVNQAPFGVYCNYGIVDAQKAVLAAQGTVFPPRAPEVRSVSALGSQFNDVGYDSDDLLIARIQGRGFKTPSNVEVRIFGQPQSILAVERDWIDFIFTPPLFGTLEVRADNVAISSITMPDTYRICYPFVEGATQGGGASVNGGFLQTLNPDNNILTCTRANNGDVFLQGNFRRVQASQQMKLVLKRRYTSAGTERISLYNWSSASYPYGTFTEIHSGAAPTTSQTIEIPIPQPANHIDFEGTIYMTVEGLGMTAGSRLELDMAHVSSDR